MCLQIEELIENDEELVQRVRQFQETIGKEPSFGNTRNLVTTSTTHEVETPRAPRRRATRNARSPPRKRALRIWSSLPEATDAAHGAAAAPRQPHAYTNRRRRKPVSQIRTPNHPIVRGPDTPSNVINSNSSANTASNSGSTETNIAEQTRMSPAELYIDIPVDRPNDVTLTNNKLNNKFKSTNKTNNTVQARKSPAERNIEILVNQTNNVTLTNDESSKQSKSISNTNNTIQARNSPNEPNINILVNQPNVITVTNNELRKKSSSKNVTSLRRRNTSVRNYLTSSQDGPGTSSGLYADKDEPPTLFMIYSDDSD